MDDREIDNLQIQLDNLTLEFNRRTSLITQQINTIRRNRIRRAERAEVDLELHSDNDQDNNTFVIGNIVRIVNNYKKQRGVVGEIIRIRTGKQERVTIRDSNGKEYTRAPWNIELIES